MGKKFFRANKDSLDIIRRYNSHGKYSYGEPPYRSMPPFERNKMHNGWLYPIHPRYSVSSFDEFI